MVPFIFRRLISGALVIVALTFTTYLVVNEIPQNKACSVIFCTSSTTPAEKQAALHQAGLDRPVLTQYSDFVWNLVRHGSLGSAANGQALNPTIEAAIPPTAWLVAGGMGLMFLLTVPLAAIAASSPRSPADRGALSFSLVGLAVHPFVLGIALQQAGAQLGLPKTDSTCADSASPFASPGRSGMIIAMRLASLLTAVSLVAVPAPQAKTLKVNWREVSTRS